MKQVIVLRAPSGAGKSSHARHLAGNRIPFPTVIVSADDYFMTTGEYLFDQTKLSEAHGACFRRYIDGLQGELSGLRTPEQRENGLIIVDNTNIRTVEVAPYMLAAQAYGWEAEIHELRVPLEVAVARNVHKVPHEAIQHMVLGMESEHLPPWWKTLRFDGLTGLPEEYLATRVAPSESPST